MYNTYYCTAHVGFERYHLQLACLYVKQFICYLYQALHRKNIHRVQIPGQSKSHATNSAPGMTNFSHLLTRSKSFCSSLTAKIDLLSGQSSSLHKNSNARLHSTCQSSWEQTTLGQCRQIIGGLTEVLPQYAGVRTRARAVVGWRVFNLPNITENFNY